DSSFHLRSVVHVPRADWRDGRWQATDAVEYPMTDGTVSGNPVPADGLRIGDLSRKGIDASHYLVDLYLKLALPFASLVLAAVAVPIAGRLRRHPSIA